MSVRFPAVNVPEAERTIELADKALSDLCSGRRRWTMNVPAEPDRDPDLIFGRLIELAESLLKAHKEN